MNPIYRNTGNLPYLFSQAPKTSCMSPAISKNCFRKIKDWILSLFKRCFETKKPPILIQMPKLSAPALQLPTIEIISKSQRAVEVPIEPIVQEPVLEPAPEPVVPVVEEPIAELPPEPVAEVPLEEPELGAQLWNTIEVETANLQVLSRKLQIIGRKLDSLPCAFSMQGVDFEEGNPYSAESTHAKNSQLILRSVNYSFITQFEDELNRLKESFIIAESAVIDAEEAQLDAQLIARMRAALNAADVVGIELFHFAGHLDQTIDNYEENAGSTLAAIPVNSRAKRQAQDILNNIEGLQEENIALMDRAGAIWREREQITDAAEITELQEICQTLLRNKNRVAEWDRQISAIWVRVYRANNPDREPDDRPENPPIPPQVFIPGPERVPINRPAYLRAMEQAMALQERRRNLEALLPRLADEVGIARSHVSSSKSYRNGQVHRERFHILVQEQVNDCRFLIKQILDGCNKTINEGFAAIEDVPPELRDVRWAVAERQNPKNAQDILLIAVVAMNHMIEMYYSHSDLTFDIIAQHFDRHVDPARNLINQLMDAFVSADRIKARALNHRRDNNRDELLRTYDDMGDLLAQTEGHVRHLEDKWYVAANNLRDAEVDAEDQNDEPNP